MNQGLKTVAIYSYVPKLHSLYTELIKTPPEGYTYAVDQSKLSSTMKSFYTNKAVKDFAFWKLNKVVDTVRIKDHLYRTKKLPPHDLLYSTGYLCLRKEPWVVDMEFPSSLTGYNLPRFIRRRNDIAKILAKPYCRRIIPWTEAASESMRMAFPELAEKIVTVPLVVSKKSIQHIDRKDGKVRLLFVGSSNLPNDFEIKGGPDVFMAYEQLLKRYDNIELVVRCYVPPAMKERYGKLPGVKIIDYIIPWKELEELYASSDIFVGVAHHTPGVAHLEAMSYGLPVIATDVWENSRIVSKDVGMLIPLHSRAKYYDTYNMPNWGFPDFMQAIQMPDDARIAALADAMSKLIDDAPLRRRMSVAARRRVEEGPYSVAARNRILKSVYDDATK